MKLVRLSDRGAALVTVIMIMLVTMTFSGIALTYVVSQSKTEAYYENNISAVHAAEAGLNQYLWYLNKEGAPEIAMDTDISYPDYHAIAKFKLHKKIAECTDSKIVIEATGWMIHAPDIKRTIKATFTKRSFTQYVYFSDNDPDNIWWMSSDTCYGPYHTNTRLSISGSPKFYNTVSYVSEIKYKEGVSNNPYFKITPEKVAAINFPLDNSALKSYAKQSGGYYFTGRTCIKLMGNQIKVRNLSGTQMLNLPTNGVIYVDDALGAGSSKFDTKAGNVFIYGELDGRLTVGSKRDIYITGYDPTIYELSAAKAASPTQGIMYRDTSFGITPDHNVQVNVTSGQEGDMLGLIADTNVAILTYGWFDDDTCDSSRRNITVHAAIFAMKGSFANSYQIGGTGNYSYPNPGGTLTVRGAIIQNTRGAVGVSYNGDETGYVKDYAHDTRMMYDSPPFFLMPEESGWEIKDWVEKE
ncbi:MAG: putative secreted protein [Herbinix sp.]|jgi:hypothetical protein|nr:putative secreted protein [Herbinix sp.]